MRPLRVCQVVTRMVRGGAQQVVLQLLRDLPRDEFQQTLICGIQDRAEGAFVEQAERAAHDLVQLPELVREVRPRKDVTAAAKLLGIFLKRRPDVVHAHTYKAGAAAAVAARMAGVRAVVFTPHGHIFSPGSRIPGVPPGGWKLEVLRVVTRLAQLCAHCVTALSDEDLEQQLSLRLSPRSKYRVIRNGIDLVRFDAPSMPSVPERPVIGSVGRFTAEKGHRYLVEAFAIVRAWRPGARLVLVGYGELEDELRAQARSLGIDEAVEFAGEQDSARMLPMFDVFVQPSLYESQGLAIIEAMAAGRPVVATGVGGVGDVVQDGSTGLVVPPAEGAALAHAILRLLDAPEWAAALAVRAQARVRDLFAVERMVGAYARLYKELLGRGRG